jgi:hypothetical protein
VPDLPSSLAQVPEAGDKAAADLDEGGIVPLDIDLDHSDAAVRDLVAGEDLPAAMRSWLEQKEILRTVVAAVDSIARGESPAAQLQFLAPSGRFQARIQDGTFWLDPQSYRRYDPLVRAFTAIPDKTWIAWYRKLAPTLEKAFRELGYPGITFAQRLQQAIEELIRVPVRRQEIALEKKILSYAFSDAALEGLDPAQKHLLRLGPDNAALIQNKLRALLGLLRSSRKK